MEKTQIDAAEIRHGFTLFFTFNFCLFTFFSVSSVTSVAKKTSVATTRLLEQLKSCH
jgi:hypothetical protein